LIISHDSILKYHIACRWHICRASD